MNSRMSIATALVLTALPASADELRILGPDQPRLDCVEHFTVQVRFTGRRAWTRPNPNFLSVTVTGAARLIPFSDGDAGDVFAVIGEASGEVTLSASYTDATISRSVEMVPGATPHHFRATVRPDQARHTWDGLGSGAFFYTNLWAASEAAGRGEELYDWAFRDVKTEFVHIMIRWNGEPENDNDDWRVIDPDRFDFAADLEAVRILAEARARRPGIKVLATMLTPPLWLKENGEQSGTVGPAGLPNTAEEIAEYTYAWLCFQKAHGASIDYLCPFNEPEFHHTQPGMKVLDFGELSTLFLGIADALEELIASGGGKVSMPGLLFPNSLGPATLTRDNAKRAALLARAAQLRERVDFWAVHDYYEFYPNQSQGADYWGLRFDELRAMPFVDGGNMWVTEWSPLIERNELDTATEYGLKILNAARLGARSWMAFEWLHPGNAGLVRVDWDQEGPRYRRHAAYWVFRQIANRTPAGSTVLDCEVEPLDFEQLPYLGVEVLALRLSDGSLQIHIYNGVDKPSDYELAIDGSDLAQLGSPSNGRLLTPFRGQPDGSQSVIAPFQFDGTAAVIQGQIPAHSLLSFAVTNIRHPEVHWNSSGQVEIRADGTAGTLYDLQRSPDLQAWHTLATIPAGPTGSLHHTDQDPPDLEGYYRFVPH